MQVNRVTRSSAGSADTDGSTHSEELCRNRYLTVISSVYLGLTWMCVCLFVHVCVCGGGAVRPSAPLTLNIARLWSTSYKNCLHELNALTSTRVCVWSALTEPRCGAGAVLGLDSQHASFTDVCTQTCLHPPKKIGDHDGSWCCN